MQKRLLVYVVNKNLAILLLVLMTKIRIIPQHFFGSIIFLMIDSSLKHFLLSFLSLFDEVAIKKS